jgi:hypothetical protein
MCLELSRREFYGKGFGKLQHELVIFLRGAGSWLGPALPAVFS